MEDVNYGAPRVSPDGQFIAYTREGQRDGEREIFVLSADGSDERPLIAHPADDQFIAWTPSGRGMLFTSNRAGTTDLWMAPVADGRVSDLPVAVRRNVGAIAAVTLTPAGALFYTTQSQETHDISVVSLDPATGRALSAPGPVTASHLGRNLAPAWSPDGKQLAFESSSSGPPWFDRDAITILATESGQEREIRPQPPAGVAIADWHRWRIVWAPDGRSMLVSIAGAPAAARGLHTIDAQTGKTETLLGGKANQTYLTDGQWLRDGRSIVFLQEWKAIMRRNVDTGEQRTIYNRIDDPNAGDISSLESLELSPDGRQAAFYANRADRRNLLLQVVDLESGQVRTIITIPGQQWWPPPLAWSPDGRYLVYADRTRTDQETLEVWRVAAAGGTPEKLGIALPNPDDAICCLSMRADGRSLAFELIHREPARTYVLEHFLPASELQQPRLGGGR